MQKILLLTLLVVSMQIFAQDPDERLFNQTWYLHEVNDTEGLDYYVTDWSPFVIINEDLSYYGEAVCKTFGGTLSHDETGTNFRTETLDEMTDIEGCVFDFQSSQLRPVYIGPFGWFNEEPDFYNIAFLNIFEDDDGYLTLRYTTQPFVGYRYRSIPVLSNPDFEKNQVQLYPNPANDVIRFSSINGVSILDVGVYSSLGQKLMEPVLNTNESSIDISGLANGMYLIEIMTNEGREVHKVFKK